MALNSIILRYHFGNYVHYRNIIEATRGVAGKFFL